MDDVSETIKGMESFILARLERFAGLAADPQVQATPAWDRLARRATMATFSDCIALGLRAEALVILRTARANLYGL
jgi:hypothetical protein